MFAAWHRCRTASTATLHHTGARTPRLPKSHLPLLKSNITQNEIRNRFNSTASVLPLQVPSTTEGEHSILDKHALRRPEYRSPHLDAVVGRDWTAKAKGIQADTKILVKELQHVFRGLRSLQCVLENRDYHVRTGALDKDLKHLIVVDGGDVKVAGKTIPSIWLRDNCQCKECVHESTKQRLLDTFSIPSDLHMKSHELSKGSIAIEWSDGHKSTYTQPFLSNAVKNPSHRAITRHALAPLHLWDSSIASNPPVLTLSPTLTVKQILRTIRKFGFVLIDSVPHSSPTPTEHLLRRISFLRETHYGTFYDFTADMSAPDTAYTNMPLPAHTDNTYFSDPAGLQALHVLSHDGEGGASLLVDGFGVAQQLWESDREAYMVLASVGVHAHASGMEGSSIQPYRAFPVLEHDSSTGDLLRVRWNTADRASIDVPVEDTGRWYAAARKFDALVKSKGNEFWELLTPGRVLVMDNWRVLHGRSGFTGRRRVCGAYLNRDDWVGRFRVEERGREGVLGGLATG